MLENLALWQQLAAFAHSGRRPRIGAIDRVLWIVLRRLWSRWLDVLVFVSPETVIRWHRAGFRFYWAWRSRRWKAGRPPMDRGILELIQRMATENPTRGAPRMPVRYACEDLDTLRKRLRELEGDIEGTLKKHCGSPRARLPAPARWIGSRSFHDPHPYRASRGALAAYSGHARTSQSRPRVALATIRSLTG
jgi:hypothetical protein